MENKKLSFSEIREIIIQRCKDNNACQPEFKKLLAAQNEFEFWTVIKNNGYWACHQTNTITVELLEQYDISALNENHIYIEEKTFELPKEALAINFNGTVSKNNGTVSYNENNGTVSENYGTVSKNYGTVSKNYGTAVVIERYKRKIYMKKGEFEIVYFD